AASWITRSPSIRPGQPRSSPSSRGVNMQSLISAVRPPGAPSDVDARVLGTPHLPPVYVDRARRCRLVVARESRASGGMTLPPSGVAAFPWDLSPAAVRGPVADLIEACALARHRTVAARPLLEEGEATR